MAITKGKNVSDLGAIALHGILSHVVPHLPRIILRRLYRHPAKLAKDVALSSVAGAVQADIARCELKIWLPVANHLPFPVSLTYVDLDIKTGAGRLANLAYSRKVSLPPKTEPTIIEFPFYSLNQSQLALINNPSSDLFLSGFADFETSFERTFTVDFHDLTCHLKPTGFVPGL